MTKGRKMIFDHRNLELVQQHPIYAKDFCKGGGSFYACTTMSSKERKKERKIHNLLMNHATEDISNGITVDHANHNTEDNRDIHNDNKTGYKGVFYSRTGHSYYYEAFYKENGKQHRKCFAVKKNMAMIKQNKWQSSGEKQCEAMSTPYKEANRTNIIGIDMNEADVYDTSDDVKYDFESILF